MTYGVTSMCPASNSLSSLGSTATNPALSMLETEVSMATCLMVLAPISVFITPYSDLYLRRMLMAAPPAAMILRLMLRSIVRTPSCFGLWFIYALGYFGIEDIRSILSRMVSGNISSSGVLHSSSSKRDGWYGDTSQLILLIESRQLLQTGGRSALRPSSHS